MATLSLSSPSVTHLMSMSAPIGSLATAISPASEFPTDGAVSATHPVAYFSIALCVPALVVLRMQEANTASRCALFLSCTTLKPNANSASWRLISPEPVKQLVLHPADPAYRVGMLTIAVHYLETSGQSSFQLRAEVRRDFFAMWLRTGEVQCSASTTADGAVENGNTQGTLQVSHTNAGPSKAMMSTLHGVLASAASRTITSPHAATVNTRGSLFTSLYIGDWRGDHREGLGFQYYAAPDDAAASGDGWQSAVRADESEDEDEAATCCSGDEGTHAGGLHPQLSTTSSQHSIPWLAATSASGGVVNPLLLLRAFCERHNLPWSAWSIPDTFTADELAELGFGYSFRLAGSNQLSRMASKTGKEARKGDADAALITLVKPSSPHPSPLNAAVPTTNTPPLPPSPPIKPRATAVEGMLVLGSVIDHLLLAEIRDADLGHWAVLPVQPGVEVYAGEWSANCKDGRGFYQWLDRSYVGEWAGGRREGFGLLRRKDGGWYRGQWERHVPHGSGEARLMPEDLLYKGEWRNGCRNGRGCLTYPDGTAVHGVWVADVLLPEVHAVYADGSTYDGIWGPEACREGRGTWTDTEGCQHIHTWSHNMRVGEGKEVYPNHVVLEGTWAADVLKSGVYVFPNGERYVGDVDAKQHVREGSGTCTSADGLTVYTGGWSRDKRTGHGVFVRYQRNKAATSSDSSAADPGVVVVERYEGEWMDDTRSGAGHQESGDEVYDGTFARDCRDGTGMLRNTRSGSFYQGHWKGDHRCGAGSCYSATKDITYEGVFLHDRLTGPGTATKGASQEQYDGLWLDGMEQGHGSLRLANGDTLRGVWHRGRPELDAEVEYIDAAERGAIRDSRYVGGWRDGARHGNGTQVLRDGSVYEGTWAHNKQHGRGRRTAPSGESVECEWVHGSIIPGCIAAVCYTDGSVYAGQVNAAGVPHGAGALTYPDGTVFDGQFTDGIYEL
ncbi:hypothetical protein ABB37_05109 [Leptomonas pyrrhocoris]|uniref:MORN repeat-containing protein n=1 Tax=Leptomonas pyrrhocoris TaxID=157538 RepID=A0A0M9G0V0_LEPPY|nr:hypothetical protein ABB37_05109 [Leptomonas pyrrhocoris]XP_015658550.1 hypothetical protein ABB37_05109 [Leptomonas pyrrhocoris]KPA80110.1 hypothetical protein ABB37_05109 [Leptomonas pyrrhocoris]KPA80111.1 hypothetical protein ABB37_05109 [Leptomonas pyrrhocoris]|eukprot:XP_015658549.1 hypothetical protein ABB37_05109 [Leptomonas pyrrhocoris]